MPKISVIITSYNCAAYISDTIASVTAQSERDLEILVIDDASTDGSLQLAREAASRDARIKIHPQTHGGKASIARNAGLKLAQGDYVCFLDGDDLYAPSKLAQQRQFLDAHQDMIAVFHDMQLIDETGVVTTNSFLLHHRFLERAQPYLSQLSSQTYVCNPQFYRFMALVHSSVHTSSIMLRRSVVDDGLRFAEDIKMAEDIEFWWAVARHRKLGYIDRQLSAYRIHGSNMTKNSETLYRDSITVHRRNIERHGAGFSSAELQQYEKKMADNWFALGYFYYCQGRNREARGHYQTALQLVIRPRFVMAYLKTLVSHKVRRLWPSGN